MRLLNYTIFYLALLKLWPDARVETSKRGRIKISMSTPTVFFVIRLYKQMEKNFIHRLIFFVRSLVKFFTHILFPIPSYFPFSIFYTSRFDFHSQILHSSQTDRRSRASLIYLHICEANTWK